jgi:hypothetical protein
LAQPLWTRICLFFVLAIFPAIGRSQGCCAPILANTAFNPSAPASIGDEIGRVRATNSPTRWAITAGNPKGDFAIDSRGVITFTSQGAADYNGSVLKKSATLTVQATNASGSGSGIVRINAYADGSANAPSGLVQHPTGLSGYRARPPWKVAGFDYYVGIPSGTSLQPASGISDPNVKISGNLVKCTGPNASVTLNAIDFAGYAIYIPLGGCSTLTVTNSNFGCTKGVAAPSFTFIQNQNNAAMDIEQNKFDSYTDCNVRSPGNISDIMQCGSIGNCTVKYNWFYHQSERAVDAGCGSLKYQFNLLDDPNTVSSAHENVLQQACGDGAAQIGLVVSFNGLYSTISANAGEGWQFEGCCGQQFATTDPVFAYNTAVALRNSGKVTMSYLVHGFCHTTEDCSTTAVSVRGTGTFSNNYFDTSGSFGAFYVGSGTAMWPPQIEFSNNINMDTGAPIALK